MIPQPVWQAAYERGLAHLRVGAMDEALKAFDEARELSDGTVSPFRPRAVVLRLLEERAFGSRCESHGAREVETSEKGDLQMLETVSDLLPAEQATVLYSSNTGPSDTLGGETGPTPVQLAQSVLASVKATRNLIDYLPPEILTIIGRFAVELTGSSDIAFRLAAVSHLWRTIFLQDSRLWGRVSLDDLPQERAMIKFESFTARGPPYHLLLRVSAKRSANQLWGTLEAWLWRMRSMELDFPALSLPQTLSVILECVRLESLRLCLPNHRESSVPLSPSAASLPSLRRITFARSHVSNHRPACIDWIPGLFPNLEELVVDDRRLVLAVEDGPAFELKSLQVLRIRRGSGPVEPSQRAKFVLPNLRELDLSNSFPESYIPYLFSSSLPPNTQHLTHLIFRPGFFHEILLVKDHLPQLAKLTHLNIRGHGTLRSLPNALTHPPTGQPGLRLCPYLTQLDLDDDGRPSDGEWDDEADISPQRADGRVAIESRAGAVKLTVRGWKKQEGTLVCLWEESGDKTSA